MIFTRKSIISGIVRHVNLPVTQEQFDLYESGWFTQDAFPHLSDEAREFIISGITNEEWLEAFGEDD